MSNHAKNVWLCLICGALIATPIALPLSRTARAADEKKAGDEKVKKTELSDRMEEMDEAMKRLRRTLRDAKQNEESLAQVKKFVDAAKATREMTPAEAAKQPKDKQAKFIEEYKKRIDEVITEMGNIEKAVKDGKLDKAQEIHAKLKKMEEDGHKIYAPDEGAAEEKK